jgi:hypothetical protein
LEPSGRAGEAPRTPLPSFCGVGAAGGGSPHASVAPIPVVPPPPAPPQPPVEVPYADTEDGDPAQQAMVQKATASAAIGNCRVMRTSPSARPDPYRCLRP